ncbi:MAG: hypothetical protein AVDCRST_MAG18-1916, partial [uncultured Thermomicrobiales bacterium]
GCSDDRSRQAHGATLTRLCGGGGRGPNCSPTTQQDPLPRVRLLLPLSICHPRRGLRDRLPRHPEDDRAAVWTIKGDTGPLDWHRRSVAAGGRAGRRRPGRESLRHLHRLLLLVREGLRRPRLDLLGTRRRASDRHGARLARLLLRPRSQPEHPARRAPIL